MKQLILAALLLVTASISFAAAPDMPRRKSGLWEITVSNGGTKGGQAMQQCIDEKSDDLTKNNMPGTKKQSCSKNEMRREGNKVVTESVCRMSGTTTTTKGVFTGQFDSNYKGDIKSTYDPPLHGMKESATTVDAKWVGACKPGQKPGDISMPGMPNINMNDMMKNMPKRP